MKGERCDFCHADAVDWFVAMKCLPRPWLGWELELCDSCRLLLRNVIGVVLHKLTHQQFVEALQAKMDELGITYDDLMGGQKQIESGIRGAIQEPGGC